MWTSNDPDTEIESFPFIITEFDDSTSDMEIITLSNQTMAYQLSVILREAGYALSLAEVVVYGKECY